MEELTKEQINDYPKEEVPTLEDETRPTLLPPYPLDELNPPYKPVKDNERINKRTN